jgi:hypothetical protein
LKRAANTAARAGGAIERFIERTLAPRIEELAGEIRGMRYELGQFEKRLSENITSLRNEMVAHIEGWRADSRLDSADMRIDALDGRLGAVENKLGTLESRLDTRLTRSAASSTHASMP